MNKKKIIKKLKKLGWEYVVDRFTHSEYGHRREHFQRLNTIEWGDGEKTYELVFVLIFHYFNKDLNRDDDCHIQTSRMIGTYDEIMPYYKGTHLGVHKTKGDTVLYTDDMKLFAKLMKVIDKNSKRGK